MTTRSFPSRARWASAMIIGLMCAAMLSVASKGNAAANKKPVVKKTAARQILPTLLIKRRSVVLGTAPAPIVTVPTTVPVTLPVVPITLATTPATLAPIASPPTTTTQTTTIQTTTTAAPIFDFDLQIPSPRVSINMGSTATVLLLVLPRGVPRPVDLFFVDLPNGVSAVGTPNPTTGGSEIRLTAATLMVPGEYPVRIMAVSGTVTKFVGYALTVLAPGATASSSSGSASGAASGAASSTSTTTTTTTTIPSGSGGFTFLVTSDGKKLKTGGSVTLTAVVAPQSNFAGTATLRVLNLPEAVWVGFSQNPSAGTSSIWLSSTLPLKPGSYQLQIEAKTSTQTSQVPVLLVIE